MNPELLMLEGMISRMSKEEQTKIKEIADKIRVLVSDNGDKGKIAIGLVGLKMQEEA